MSAELALASLPASRRAGSKRMLIEGLRVDSGRWEPPQAALSRRASERGGTAAPARPADVRYREFQVGVQMANRGGALNEIEYSEFVQKVQAFADAVGALVELPDMRDAVARARELDAFAAEHDAQLAVHLRAQAGAVVARLRAAARLAARLHRRLGAGPAGAALARRRRAADPGAVVRPAGGARRRSGAGGGLRPHAELRRAADAGRGRALRRLAVDARRRWRWRWRR